MVLSSLMAAPATMFAIVVNPGYWNPRLILPLPIGIEDILFNLTNGGMVWMCAAGFLSWVRPQKAQPVFSVRRALSTLAFGITASIVLFLAGFRNNAVPFMVMASWIVLLFCLRKENWILACFGATIFTVLYLALFKAVMAIWPHYLSVFNVTGLWGKQVWQIPLGEIAWAALYGAAWPMMIAYIFDIRFDQPGRCDLEAVKQEDK